jgi:hypothetical protein
MPPKLTPSQEEDFIEYNGGETIEEECEEELEQDFHIRHDSLIEGDLPM